MLCSVRIYSRPAIYTLVAVVVGLPSSAVWGDPIRNIVVDGSFDDWSGVPSHFDPPNDQHDTDHDGQFDTPAFVNHPDVDLREYKIAHDENNLYAYFRARGQIGATQHQADGNGRAGRYYVIVTIDVDNKDTTGYWLHEGGYYPTSRGYDMNMEIEYYDGAFNTGHYINHGALTGADIPTLEAQQKQGIVNVLPGTYENYTQWVMFPNSTSGDFDLQDGTSITFVADKGPVYQGIVSAAISPDGHELEMVAPFIGFMSYPGSQPGQRGGSILKLGRTIDVSFSLEASGELTTPPGDNGEWGSDTGAPFRYFLETPGVPGDYDGNGVVDGADYVVFRNGGPLLNEVATIGTITAEDYTEWRNRFGNISGSGSGLGAGVVPEPGMMLLMLVGFAFFLSAKPRVR